MCAKPAIANPDSHPRRPPVQRSQFARNAGHLDMKDVKVALDIIIRPSLQLWKLVPGRSVVTIFKRAKKTALLCDNTSSTSSLIPKKKVRFDEKPVTISRRSFFERCRKDSCSSPARPCLVIRDSESCDTYTKSPEPPLETDALSVYEDCLSDHPGFFVDLQVLEGGEHFDTRTPQRIRKSEFYEMESGIAMFDRAGYASYCLYSWLDKQREETRAEKERVFDSPALVSWPNRALPLTPPASSLSLPDGARPVTPPTFVCRPPRSLPWRICKYVEDELQNAIVIVVIGLFIHICLFFFLVYDILKRGFVPSRD